jgi:uncharacterized protein YcfL
MRKILIALALFAFILTGCGSSKQSPDYDKVDESFDEFKKKNPDSD